MPRISAPTVAEHHAQVRDRLVDAAETLLREGRELTAGEVSASAGIARNSIYRYVDSVDDLRALVVERHLPDWISAVTDAVRAAADPADRVAAWVTANLDRALETGHGWLMRSAAGAADSPRAAAVGERAHAELRKLLADAWGERMPIDPERARVAAALTLGLLDAGFRLLEHPALDGGAHPPTVRDRSAAAARALVAALGE